MLPSFFGWGRLELDEHPAVLMRDWLRRASGDGAKVVKSIKFDGERQDVMAVRVAGAGSLRAHQLMPNYLP